MYNVLTIQLSYRAVNNASAVCQLKSGPYKVTAAVHTYYNTTVCVRIPA